MPNQQQPDGGLGPRRRRLVRYGRAVVIRVDRDDFVRVFSAAKYAGAASASDWMRRVLGDAAAREIDRHKGRQHRPLGG